MSEEIHRSFHEVRGALAVARAQMNTAMRLLGEEAENFNSDMERFRQQVAVQRDVIDKVRNDLGLIGAEVTRKTGCDGSCKP